MNPALTAVLVAAHHSETVSPVNRLTKAGAVRSDTAIAIANPTPAEQKQIDDAIGQGLIQRRADGRLFVNRRAVDERNATTAAQVVLGALIALSIVASGAALLLFVAR